MDLSCHQVAVLRNGAVGTPVLDQQKLTGDRVAVSSRMQDHAIVGIQVDAFHDIDFTMKRPIGAQGPN